MARFSGPQRKGALREYRAATRAAAEQRQAEEKARDEARRRDYQARAAASEATRLHRLISSGDLVRAVAVSILAERCGVDSGAARKLLDKAGA